MGLLKRQLRGCGMKLLSTWGKNGQIFKVVATPPRGDAVTTEIRYSNVNAKDSGHSESAWDKIIFYLIIRICGIFRFPAEWMGGLCQPGEYVRMTVGRTAGVTYWRVVGTSWRVPTPTGDRPRPCGPNAGEGTGTTCFRPPQVCRRHVAGSGSEQRLASPSSSPTHASEIARRAFWRRGGRRGWRACFGQRGGGGAVPSRYRRPGVPKGGGASIRMLSSEKTRKAFASAVPTGIEVQIGPPGRADGLEH